MCSKEEAKAGNYPGLGVGACCKTGITTRDSSYTHNISPAVSIACLIVAAGLWLRHSPGSFGFAASAQVAGYSRVTVTVDSLGQ